jgi:UDP-glucose 4-epimerase
VKILITGGAGYIGSVTAHMAVRAGHEVTVLDDLSTGHRDNVPAEATFVKGDLARVKYCGDFDPYDAVLHFAAKAIVSESVASPASYWHTNVGGSMSLLDTIKFRGIPRVVFSSSCAVYGRKTSDISETADTRPINPYGASKLASDMALANYAGACGFGAISLRYFNVAGTGFGLKERHSPETHLIPNVVRAAVEGEAVDIYGVNYPTADGTCIRDYVHVIDLARAHLLALEAVPSAGHLVYNLGSGRGYSVLDVVDAVENVTGLKVRISLKPRRAGDPPRLVADYGRASRGLVWQPELDLRRMIEDLAP